MNKLASAARNLAEKHRTTPVGAFVELRKPAGCSDQQWADIVIGAGFSSDGERLWTLADSVGLGMKLLICGLNPSPSSADSGIGFARPGNRFWPAMLAAGLATDDRDPLALLDNRQIGMTDIVKRTTRKAAELSTEEFSDGLERVERLAQWLQPESICFVGLAGWRAAVDKRASAGWQEREFGGRPVYLMPSTSGLNASSQLPDLTEHLLRASSRQSTSS